MDNNTKAEGGGKKRNVKRSFGPAPSAEVIAAAGIYNPPTGTVPIIDDKTLAKDVKGLAAHGPFRSQCLSLHG